MAEVKFRGPCLYNIVEIENKGTSQVERSYVDTSCSVEKNLFFQLKAAISFLSNGNSLFDFFVSSRRWRVSEKEAVILFAAWQPKIVTIISAQATPGAASHQARL